MRADGYARQGSFGCFHSFRSVVRTTRAGGSPRVSKSAHGKDLARSVPDAVECASDGARVCVCVCVCRSCGIEPSVGCASEHHTALDMIIKWCRFIAAYTGRRVIEVRRSHDDVTGGRRSSASARSFRRHVNDCLRCCVIHAVTFRSLKICRSPHLV
jgi:hypothetical protein